MLAITSLLALFVCISTVTAIPVFIGAGFQGFDQPNATICPGGVYNPRFILASTENWWRRELKPSGGFDNAKDFGHLHNEQCLPHFTTAPDNGEFQVVTRVHQNPGVVKYVLLTDVTNDVSKDIYSAKFQEPRSASRMESSGGVLVMDAKDKSKRDVKWIDTLRFNKKDFRYGGVVSMKTSISADEDEKVSDGLRRMKALVTVRTLMDNGHKSSGINPNDPDQNVIYASGWGSDVLYTTVKLWMPPKAPIGGIWRVQWSAYPGTSDSARITRRILTFNANFHMDIPGIVAINNTGEFDGMNVLNVHNFLGREANGWHKASFIAKAISKDGATNTAALGLQIQVSNGANCNSFVQTHAKSDAALILKDNGGKGGWDIEREDNPGVRTPINPFSNSKLQVAEFTYDLTFFQGPKGIARAFIWVYLLDRTGGKTTLYAFDGDSTNVKTGTACVDPKNCKPIGQGQLSERGSWTMISIRNAEFLAKAVAKNELKVILSVANGSGSASIRGADSAGSPPLWIKPRC